jgi:hypothetical protein
MNINTGARMTHHKKKRWKPPPPPKPREKPGRKEPSERAMMYAEYRVAHPDENKTAARDAAGYSQNSDPTNLEKRPTVRKAMATVEAQREELRAAPGAMLEDVVTRLVTRATDPDVSAGTQTDNDKLLSNVLGYNAPTVVHQQRLGLMLEFTDMTPADIAALRQGLIGGGVDE